MVSASPPKPGVSSAQLGPWIAADVIGESGLSVARGLTYTVDFSGAISANIALVVTHGQDRSEVQATRAKERAVVHRDDAGYGLCARVRDGEHWELAPVYPKDGVSVMRAPVTRWCHDLGDAWLPGALEQLPDETPFGSAVALGMLIRLQRPSPEVARRRFQAALNGQELPGQAAPARFASRITPTEKSTLADAVIDETAKLSELVDVLEDTVDPDSDDWCTEATTLLRRRDHLESALSILAFDLPDNVKDAVATLDAKARQWLRAAPEWALTGDIEGLHRARVEQPDAWWATPAR